MSLYKRSDLRSRASTKRLSKAMVVDSLTKIANASDTDVFDIFLSHRFLDAEEVMTIVDDLKAEGFSVYVDWQVDSKLDRGNVTKTTAQLLRKRMKQCRALLYVVSENSSTSKWMPWELGFMDARTDKVAVVPVLDDTTSGSQYKGQEYLGIYPYIDKDPKGLFVNEDVNTYVSLKGWMTGSKPTLRT